MLRQQTKPTAGNRWQVIELAVRVPSAGGIAILRNESTASVHMPLLTSIEAPPGAVLVCDGIRMDAAAFATQRAPAGDEELARCSDVVRGFVETLTPSQVEAMPAFLDWNHHDEVVVEVGNCDDEAVVVRGLNQMNMMAPRFYAYESAYYKYS
jgi:hypothetical protein